MKVVVLGANGMLGHQISRLLTQRHECYAVFRSPASRWVGRSPFKNWRSDHLIGEFDALDMEPLAELLGRIDPQVVINCVGIVKQRKQAKETIPSIRINALFPHLLADVCSEQGSRLIHFSTDCVFSGNRGAYREDDIPDPVDLYGRSKLLGEVSGSGALTLRLSIVGWELEVRQGLLEWFAGQRGSQINGFVGAKYTGLSTATAAGLVQTLVEDWPVLNGVYHVASAAINKYELLLLLKNRLEWKDIRIRPETEFFCDRSLIGDKFHGATGWRAPAWQRMVDELAREWPLYEKWRNEKEHG